MQKGKKTFLISIISVLFSSFIIVPCLTLAYDPGAPDSVWVGNLDGSNIVACPGDTIDIPVWVKNDEDVIIMYFPIAIDDDYIVADLGGRVYGILDTIVTPHWDYYNFTVNFSDRPYSGYTSYPLLTMSEHGSPYNWLPFNTQGSWVKAADFTLELSSEPSLIGSITQIIEGENPVTGGTAFVEYEFNEEFAPLFVGGSIEIVPAGYEYLPGDANMVVAGWPPMVTGADITYLVYYFLGQNQPCLFEGFYAAADANGSCQVTNADNLPGQLSHRPRASANLLPRFRAGLASFSS